MSAGPACHLVVLRHGQSEWNAAGRFTGWVNAELTQAGEREAVRAGALLAAHGLFPACAHTSLQRRTKGPAGQVLVAAAGGADLLVVGCRGHSGLTGAVLGSVSQYCVHHASCPVVVMRGKPAPS